MEFSMRCKVPVCGEHQAWTTQEAAHAAGAWHVYDQHREIWEAIAGDREPVDRRPEDLGRRFEDWEMQS